MCRDLYIVILELLFFCICHLVVEIILIVRNKNIQFRVMILRTDECTCLNMMCLIHGLTILLIMEAVIFCIFFFIPRKFDIQM